MLSDGFATSAAGFGETSNSFVAGLDAFAPWMPSAVGFAQSLFHGGSNLMGGGLNGDFAGAGALFDFEHTAFGGGPFIPHVGKDCTYSSSTGRVTCPAVTRAGLTINRSYAFTDKTNKAQSAPDTNTNTVNTQVSVSGTITGHKGDLTTAVNHTSDQTVGGLLKTSTARTVNGTSSGTELSSGTNAQGSKFTSMRTMGDTTQGLTIPVTNGRSSYPTAGTVVRSMKVTVTIAGQAPATSTRRETIKYDGSATAKVTITQDGTTNNCTLPLPHGRLTCS